MCHAELCAMSMYALTLCLIVQGPLVESERADDGTTVLVPTLRGAEGSSQLAKVADDVAKSYAFAAKELENMVKPRVSLLSKMAL